MTQAKIPIIGGKPPTEKQKEFFLADARYIAYGGARGGGKSWAMRRKFVLLALGYSGLRLLLLRRTFPQLNENHIRTLYEELVPRGIAKYNKEERVFTFPTGSIIKMGYCDSEEDAYQYQGQEYEVVGFEEATQFTEFQMRYILTCNRTVRTDFSPRAYFTCNPGGVGHDYIKRLFIDRIYDLSCENPDDYLFIQALVDDNPYLMEADPSYVRMLDSLPEDLRRAYREGDWNVIDGQYFKEYRHPLHVIEPFDPPPHWKRFRAMDWGYNDPCAVLWFACDEDGHVYVYREYYKRETPASDLAHIIRGMSEGERIGYTVASPDIWQDRGIVKDALRGSTISEILLKNGLSVIKADNSRINGWQRVRDYLGLAPDGIPYLRIMRNCTNLIRTLPLATYNPIGHGDREDVSAKCEDHALEALRYGLMSRPPLTKRVVPPESGKTTRGIDPFSEPRRRRYDRNDFYPTQLPK